MILRVVASWSLYQEEQIAVSWADKTSIDPRIAQLGKRFVLDFYLCDYVDYIEELAGVGAVCEERLGSEGGY